MDLRRPQATEKQFLEWLSNGTLLSSQSQVLLMYGDFQIEMPTHNSLSIAHWLRQVIKTHGMPSLLRMGPRSRPRVFRKDEFVQVLNCTATAA